MTAAMCRRTMLMLIPALRAIASFGDPSAINCSTSC